MERKRQMIASAFLSPLLRKRYKNQTTPETKY